VIQLVRELVQDHVVPVAWVGRAVLHVVPREHNDAILPRLPQTPFVPDEDAASSQWLK
jgi:hypothetical protein